MWGVTKVTDLSALADVEKAFLQIGIQQKREMWHISYGTMILNTQIN